MRRKVAFCTYSASRTRPVWPNPSDCDRLPDNPTTGWRCAYGALMAMWPWVERSAVVSGIDQLTTLNPNIPAHERARGSCGIGFLANNDGMPTRDVVLQAID